MFNVQTPKGEIAFTFNHYRAVNVWIGKDRPKYITDVTLCRMTLDGKPFAGVSLCSIDDNFTKERGRKLALVRTLQNALMDRTIRTEVWKRYFARRQSNADYSLAVGSIPAGLQSKDSTSPSSVRIVEITGVERERDTSCLPNVSVQ